MSDSRKVVTAEEVARRLDEAEGLIQRASPGEADALIRDLIHRLPFEDLQVWEIDLRKTIKRFFPKRRRDLTATLESKLTAGDTSPADREGDIQDVVEALRSETSPFSAISTDTSVFDGFHDALRNLSERHIFQWATLYRDVFSGYFSEFLALAIERGSSQEIATMVRRLVGEHAHEIFDKGFFYQTRKAREPRREVIIKGVNGLQRFLDLPIEFYSTRSGLARDVAVARHLRSLCSAMLGAIIEGYASVTFDDTPASAILPKYARSWAHTLPFLEEDDLDRVILSLEDGPLRQSIGFAVKPFIQALDELCTEGHDFAPLPAYAQLIWDSRRLDASLHPPPYADSPQLLEVQCYLDEAFVHRSLLEESAGRGIALVIAPLRADVSAWAMSHDFLKERLVPAATDDRSQPVARQRALDVLEGSIYTRRSPRVTTRPIQYNFARQFPLHNTSLTRYYHVYRSSVRELLQAFEKRNGVRLWCSIRRSGKTTACMDLDSSSGRSVVVTQTCDSTEQTPDATLFYDAVCDALSDGQQLPRDFFSQVVLRCARAKAMDDRYVFVLDEYETLFGRLRAAANRDAELRYTVVQPLMNQMVAFTRSNLLVFLGQRPDAHFILMDQNQLSAHVEQDSFPLFRHDPESLRGEFSELLRRVLTDRVPFDLSFANAVYAETSGHPYLTVNLLVEFVDWLIEEERSLRGLELTSDDFTLFTSDRLSKKERISLSPEYNFFRSAIADAVGSEGRTQAPWLYAIYATLRELALANPRALRCTRRDFSRYAEVVCAGLPFSAEDLLRTGSQANFFAFDDRYVRPRIKLLGRLAAVSQARVSA